MLPQTFHFGFEALKGVDLILRGELVLRPGRPLCIVPFGCFAQFSVAEIRHVRKEFRTGKKSVRLKFTGREAVTSGKYRFGEVGLMGERGLVKFDIAGECRAVEVRTAGERSPIEFGIAGEGLSLSFR